MSYTRKLPTEQISMLLFIPNIYILFRSIHVYAPDSNDNQLIFLNKIKATASYIHLIVEIRLYNKLMSNCRYPKILYSNLPVNSVYDIYYFSRRLDQSHILKRKNRFHETLSNNSVYNYKNCGAIYKIYCSAWRVNREHLWRKLQITKKYIPWLEDICHSICACQIIC